MFKKKELKKKKPNAAMSKEQRNQQGGSHIDQRWENLSIKVIIAVDTHCIYKNSWVYNGT